MLKKIFFYFFALLPCTFISLDAAIEDVWIEEIETASGWPLYTTGTEGLSFQVRFPLKPEINANDDTIVYTCIDKTKFPLIIYNLTVQATDTELDASTILNQQLKHFSTHPLILMTQNVFTTSDGIVIDLFSGQVRNRVLRKDRTLITPSAVYTFTTYFFALSPDNHEYFVDSFVLKQVVSSQ